MSDFTPISRRRLKPDGTPVPDPPKPDPDAPIPEGKGSWMFRLGASGALAWASRRRKGLGE